MRLLGGAMVALGVLAFWAPMVIGGWSLALLSIPMATLSVAEARATFASPRCAEVSAYLPSLFAMLGAAVVFLSPALVLNGLLILLALSMAISGVSKIVTAVRDQDARMFLLVNGLTDVAMALLLWFLRDIFGTTRVIGVAIGTYLAAAGWRMLLTPGWSAQDRAVAHSRSTRPGHCAQIGAERHTHGRLEFVSAARRVGEFNSQQRSRCS